MTENAQSLSPNTKEFLTHFMAVRTACDAEIDHPDRMMRALEAWLEREGYSDCVIDRQAFMGTYNVCKSDQVGVTK